MVMIRELYGGQMLYENCSATENECRMLLTENPVTVIEDKYYVEIPHEYFWVNRYDKQHDIIHYRNKCYIKLDVKKPRHTYNLMLLGSGYLFAFY